MTNTPKPQFNGLDEIDYEIITKFDKSHLEFEGTIVSMRLKLTDKAKQQIQALITKAKIEGGQVSINTEIPKKITGFESMPAMSICRNLTIQDAKINEIIDYLSQLALKENK